MAKKKVKKFLLKKIIDFKKIIFVGAFILLALTIITSTAYFFLKERIYPGISVARVDIGLLSREQASSKLTQQLNQRINTPQTFVNPLTKEDPNRIFSIGLNEGISKEEFDLILDQAFEYGHKKPFFSKIDLKFSLGSNTLVKQAVKGISSIANLEPINAQLKVDGDQISITPSQEGLIVDENLLLKTLENYLNTGILESSTIPFKISQPKISYEQAVKIKNRLDQIKLAPLKLQFKDLNFTLKLDTILSLIDLENSESSLASLETENLQFEIKSVGTPKGEISDVKLTLNEDKLLDYLKSIKSQIDREVEEPLFSFDPSAGSGRARVTEFRPPQEGRKLDLKKSYAKISSALITPFQSTVNLPVEIVPPKNKLTNDLGIKELIGQGVSHFTGSIPNRIFNISLTASKINGILIPPNEFFSFNNAVGEISSATGFKQAYVIKSGRTVLDDGGGVCQDSTTLFRAVLNAGLPVLKRVAHAYRVGYYEQGFPPGLDATVYAPSVDFQFKNDTGSHILIQAYTSGNSLYVDLYGTSDGRVSKISTPKVTNQTPPPAELRQDDPTLPKGVVKQVDFSAWGANVTFTRTVTRGGEVLIDETYRSNYRPWQAIYLVGTQ